MLKLFLLQLELVLCDLVLFVDLVKRYQLVALVSQLVNQRLLILGHSVQVDVLASEHVFNLLLLGHLQPEI